MEIIGGLREEAIEHWREGRTDNGPLDARDGLIYKQATDRRG